jgi:peptide/nickel transport system substrate-binding protein
VEGKKGGKVTFLAAADVDYLDPGQTYYTFGYAVAYATHRPLYSFEPDDAETPVPDLAEKEPQISPDNKTITVKRRTGVRFSPPVNREVTSKDVKYAFERAFTKNVPSGYAMSYFADIKGAPDGPGDFKDISGIKTPDDRTIAFELDKPTAVTVAAALVMPISAPVPEEVPGIPYSWDDSFSLASKDVQGVMNGYTTVWDFAYSSLSRRAAAPSRPRRVRAARPGQPPW